MGRRIYVGNLSYDTTNDTLAQLFGAHGKVDSAEVIMDRETGRSRGFGFVEMSTQEEANKAIAEFNGKDLQGRKLVVNEAKPREDRPRGGGFGGGGGGGGGERREKREFGRGRY